MEPFASYLTQTKANTPLRSFRLIQQNQYRTIQFEFLFQLDVSFRKSSRKIIYRTLKLIFSQIQIVSNWVFSFCLWSQLDISMSNQLAGVIKRCSLIMSQGLHLWIVYNYMDEFFWWKCLNWQRRFNMKRNVSKRAMCAVLCVLVKLHFGYSKLICMHTFSSKRLGRAAHSVA